MNRQERILVPGPAGQIETALDYPANDTPRGIALVAHPHPLYGGALDNKVAQTLAWAFRDLGYLAVRPNFRGVGQSEGQHDLGIGETDDIEHVVHWAATHAGIAEPVKPVLAGFSFGSYVCVRLAQRFEVERMVLVGTAVGRVSGDREYPGASVPADSILIHGELDETVPIANVFAWAGPLDIPVVVIPGADHFFRRRLNVIRGIVTRAWPSSR
jgi:alpha/beta superfamily hydrolase